MQFSISFNQSHKSNMSHNNREHNSGNLDIDQERSDFNIYFVKEDIREVYKELFEEAVESYNAKQSRSDRKIEDYYIKIHNDSKTHEQRELIVALGEGKDPDDFREGKREALIDYALEFEERNPNLKVYNMVLHDDEANPHLHINYVPHFESKRGLTKRVGMDKALQQQGIEGKGKELIGNWRAVETARIEALAKENIPNFERANVGSHKYMKVPQFKEYAETLNTLEKEVENQKADLEAIEDVKQQEKAKLGELKQEKSQLVDEIKEKNFEIRQKGYELKQTIREIDKTEEVVQEKVAKLESVKKEIEEVETPLNSIKSIKPKKVLGHVTIKEKEFEYLVSLAKQTINKDEMTIGLQKENKELKSKVHEQQQVLEKKSSQVDRYFSENTKLKRLNTKLINEVEKYQKLYEYAKDWLKKFKIFEKVKDQFVQQEKHIEKEQKQKENELTL